MIFANEKTVMLTPDMSSFTRFAVIILGIAVVSGLVPTVGTIGYLFLLLIKRLPKGIRTGKKVHTPDDEWESVIICAVIIGVVASLKLVGVI